MFLFFDTETTGLPKNWKAPMSDLDNWPRVIQLAWIVAGEDGNILSQQKYFIKPDGWVIPNEKFWIENNYSTERCEQEGVAMPAILDLFIDDVNRCEHLIAHNMDYDHNVLGAEMLRYKKSSPKILTKHCTKLIGTVFCKIANSYGGYKWPTLSELHQKLFDTGFDGAHDALNDVRACMKCFFELRKLENSK